ncbi:DUF663-domain-containing protein [Ceraceosorus guamensis]|uniref:DUF663-domain-containing protein n=1 Tax=Ceraceosorus guamensis TaxID=1522189 RepID=A0A316VTT8_9BASI|nr:DUF663-domain-containing protein [Ceraceosorus guamensis]PWN41016.1 DUF663-domain-containing protein [Ceraceosorus guamensis]
MAPPQQGHHHRSVLKQKHKAFGRRHASKGELKARAKGRTGSEAGIGTTTRSVKQSPFSAGSSGARTGQHAKDVRKRRAKDVADNKRRALIEAKRMFSGPKGAPRTVVFASLSHDVDAWQCIKQLEAVAGEEDDLKAIGEGAHSAQRRMVEYDVPRFRTKLQLHAPAYGALYPLLDLAQCADFVIFVLSPSTSIDPGSWGELALRIMQAQGLPSVLAAVPTLTSDEVSALKAGPRMRAVQAARSSLLSFARYFAPGLDKIHALDEKSDRSSLIRTLATSTPRRAAWREARSWGIVEQASWLASTSEALLESEAQRGNLSVETWVRGAPLSAQRLVHLPDFGDFVIRRIESAPHVNATHKHAHKARKGGDVEMTDAAEAKEETEVLDDREEGYADELISENEPDDMENEQTWPTAEEMQHAVSSADLEQSATSGVRFAEVPDALPGTTPKAIIKSAVPGKGMALSKEERERKRFQAAWIIDDDDDDDDEDEEEEEEGSIDEAMNDVAANREGAEPADPSADFDGVSDEEVTSDMDDIDMASFEAYQAGRAAERERRKAEDEDLEFPDEVDTPVHIPARQRFARYRGLKSMRTSEWDPYEDLPSEYAKIFQFDSFRKTRRRVEGEALEEGVAMGHRVRVVIENVPLQAAIRAGAVVDGVLSSGEDQSAMVLFGLLRHEHKTSVLNFTVSRNTEYEEPVKSKDPLLLCLGPRRMRVQPIFSQHNPANNGQRGSNNVHKFERFLRSGPGATSVGTVFGPITFGSANVPAILLRERSEDGTFGHDQRGVGARQMPWLVGSGNLLDAGPTRINTKRICLTGSPYKVHRKSSVIKWMFFNANDVHYFKPLELHTKYGKTGHITESLGTHGLFKAHFSGPINQMDTILLNLYKRVYPKWTTSLFRDGSDELPLRVAQESAEGKKSEAEGSIIDDAAPARQLFMEV